MTTKSSHSGWSLKERSTVTTNNNSNNNNNNENDNDSDNENDNNIINLFFLLVDVHRTN